jgi:predicted peptidase
MTRLIAFALLALVRQDPAQETQAKTFDGPGGKLLYRIYQPKAAAPGNKLPLLLFLHGAGERGDDNAAQLKHGLKQFIAQQEKYPCFIVAPQCPKNKKWAEVDWSAATHATPEKPSDSYASLIPLLESLQKELPIDSKRLYVTGLSMGGYGTWDLITRLPDTFAAAAPICGGGDESKAAVIAKVPQWIFHGSADTAVKPERSRNMVEALKKAGGAPKYTEYPGVGHNSWDKAYADPELWTWMFAQKKP